MRNKELIKKRIEMGVTQADVAGAIGVSVATYSLLESGVRRGSLKTWLKLKDYFKIKEEDMWRLYANNQKEKGE